MNPVTNWLNTLSDVLWNWMGQVLPSCWSALTTVHISTPRDVSDFIGAWGVVLVLLSTLLEVLVEGVRGFFNIPDPDTVRTQRLDTIIEAAAKTAAEQLKQASNP